jgi:hypothetical protein
MGPLELAAGTRNQEHHTHENESAPDERWQGDGMGFSVLDLDGTELGVFFGLVIAEALVGEGENSEGDEDDAGEFHKKNLSG